MSLPNAAWDHNSPSCGSFLGLSIRCSAPAERTSYGSKQRTCFQTKKVALWSAVAIYRILKNEIYTGTLVQGKTTSPNHKVKKTVVKPQSEWARTENAHEPIIAHAQFDLVQKLMLDDTRNPSGATGVHPFSGKIYCADCGSPMVRRVSRCGEKEYAYFICGGNKSDKISCSSHSIKESVVYDAVLAVVQGHIDAAMNMADALKRIDDMAWENREIEKIKARISFQEEIIDKNRRLKTGAYFPRPCQDQSTARTGRPYRCCRRWKVRR